MNQQPGSGAERSDMLLVLTTEQFTLQLARSSAASEITARAGMFLTTVSIALLALAFISQTASLQSTSHCSPW